MLLLNHGEGSRRAGLWLELHCLSKLFLSQLDKDDEKLSVAKRRKRKKKRRKETRRTPERWMPSFGCLAVLVVVI